jgi:hypothetical protein
MRWSGSFGVLAIAATLVAVDNLSIAAPNVSQPVQRSAEIQVDVELVLAVDVSLSMDLDELGLQREGYAEAITSDDFIKALRTGPRGRVALTYFEWSSAGDQRIIIPWRVIDGPESAGSVAAEIMNGSLRRGSRTSISGAIHYGMRLLGENPYKGLRRVVDISGDGANNSGDEVQTARDVALRDGITINGLPLMLKEAADVTVDIEQLDVYYEDCVTGGPGSFVIPVKEKARFKEAIRTKLVLEVSEFEPREIWKARVPGQPRIPCTIGEQLWRQRWQR